MLGIKLATLLFIVMVVSAVRIPVGTVIPIMISSSLNAENDKPGKKIEGRVMQKVPLPSGEIREGSRVLGHIEKVTKSGSSGATLVVKFDAIQDKDHNFDVTTRLLAVASSGSVFEAQSPISANSDRDPPTQWATRQVGGDVVRRGWGKVGTSNGLSGQWVGGSSVLIKLTPNSGAGCPDGPGYDREQAVWIFSSAACGAYGLGDLKIVNSGGSPPLGEIQLASNRNVSIRGGSGWLLIVVAEGGH